MKTIQEYIIESSRNEKKRNEIFAKNLFTRGKKVGGIFAFGILTCENADSADPSKLSVQEKRNLMSLNKRLNKEFSSILKQSNYKFIPIEGHFGGVVEHSLLVFNIGVEELKQLAGKYEQTSVFYCEPDDKGNIVSQFWQKKDTHAKYNSVKNPYEMIEENTAWSKLNKNAIDNYSVIGGDFKYTIDMKIFETVSNDIYNKAVEINEGNENAEQIATILTESYFKTGQYYYNKRIKLNGY